MGTEKIRIISHISIGTNNFDRAISFYDKVLATLGCKQKKKYPGAVAYGKDLVEFWVQRPINGELATTGNGMHIGFVAETTEEVDAFYHAALSEGGKGDGAPGPRPDYGDEYYGCFIRDLDGNKIEATYWNRSD